MSERIEFLKVTMDTNKITENPHESKLSKMENKEAVEKMNKRELRNEKLKFLWERTPYLHETDTAKLFNQSVHMAKKMHDNSYYTNKELRYSNHNYGRRFNRNINNKPEHPHEAIRRNMINSSDYYDFLISNSI